MAVEDADDLATFFDTDEFAASAIYTPPGGGAAHTIDVIFDQVAPQERGPDGEIVIVKRRSLRVLKSAFTTVPAVNGTFLVGGITYRVRAIEDDPDDPTGQIYNIILAVTS